MPENYWTGQSKHIMPHDTADDLFLVLFSHPRSQTNKTGNDKYRLNWITLHLLVFWITCGSVRGGRGLSVFLFNWEKRNSLDFSRYLYITLDWIHFRLSVVCTFCGKKNKIWTKESKRYFEKWTVHAFERGLQWILTEVWQNPRRLGWLDKKRKSVEDSLHYRSISLWMILSSLSFSIFDRIINGIGKKLVLSVNKDERNSRLVSSENLL